MVATDATREQHEEQSAVDGGGSPSAVPTVDSSDTGPVPAHLERTGRGRYDRSVIWLKDPAWFASEVSKGPCPAAAAIYSGRYSLVQNRTCWDRLHEIKPLRAHLLNGSISWSSWSDVGEPANVTIVGDSLAEQHFVAIVCYAWSAGVPMDGPHRLKQDHVVRTGLPDWRATIGGALRLTFKRQETIPKTLDRDVYAAPLFLIIGGFHHGHSGLAEYIRAVAELRGVKQTLVVEALPAHFPGGAYRAHGIYPSTKSALRNAKCDNIAMRPGGEPAVNGLIAQTTDTLFESKHSPMRTIQVEKLYRHRGQAHIGPIPAAIIVGPRGRDCLHWCVAPGVLDALALLTLHKLAAF